MRIGSILTNIGNSNLYPGFVNNYFWNKII